MKIKSLLLKTNLFVRSLIFSTLSILFLIPYSSCLILTSPFLSLKNRFKIVAAYNSLAINLLKIICNVDYKIHGLENIPKERAGVILSKHQSTWETFCIPCLFNEPAIIVKRELLWVPFFGWGLTTIQPIAIDRKKTSHAMEQIIVKGRKYIEEGRWILVFPEGTRIPYGQVGKYRLGGARLAVATGYPVIPIAHNAGLFWPRRKFIKHPGTVHMVIGPLMESVNKTPEQLMNEVQEWIESTVLKIKEM